MCFSSRMTTVKSPVIQRGLPAPSDRAEPTAMVRQGESCPAKIRGGAKTTFGGGAVAKENPRDEADPSAKSRDGEWARVLSHLKREIGDAAYRSWLEPISLARCDEGHAIL